MGIEEECLPDSKGLETYFTRSRRILKWKDGSQSEFADDEIIFDLIHHYSRIYMAGENYQQSPCEEFKQDIILWLHEVDAKTESFVCGKYPRSDFTKSHIQHFHETVEKTPVGPERRRTIKKLHNIGIINKKDYLCDLMAT